MIYLDNSMTTRPSDKAVSAMLPFLSEKWGTPSAPHHFGQKLFPAIEESYRSIYALLGAKEGDTFVFTSSGTEAINHVVSSAYYDITRPTGKNHFLTANIDQAPSIMAMGRLEQMGCVSRMVEVNQDGIITADAVADVITPRTALLSLSWGNGMTGVINPVKEIAELCHDRGIKLHLDATHVLGKLYFELDDIGADFITFNGDNLHAPKGTGGLWVKQKVPCSPMILGGMEQGGYRAGSFNVPGLIALGVAATEALEARDFLCTEIARLRNKFEKKIFGTPFFADQERLPHITTIGFPGIANEALLYALNRKKVFGSIGGGTFQQIGLILEASGIDHTLAHSAINFTLSRETTESEIDKAIEIIKETVSQLQKMSSQFQEGQS